LDLTIWELGIRISDFVMSEILIGKVDEFFYLKSFGGCLIAFRNEKNINLKVGDKVKLTTPESEVVEIIIKGIPMISRRYEEGIVPDFKLMSMQIENTERNKKGFPKDTEIYLIKEE
jgi:hypothetical protein